MKGIETVLVVGAGIMGHGFAQFFAQTGLHVILIDRTEALLERARGMIANNLEYMVELGEIESIRAESVLQKIRYSTAFEQEARDSDFVLEAGVDPMPSASALAETIKRYLPQANLEFVPDKLAMDFHQMSQGVRWDESPAVTEWGWRCSYDLDRTVKDFVKELADHREWYD